MTRWIVCMIAVLIGSVLVACAAQSASLEPTQTTFPGFRGGCLHVFTKEADPIARTLHNHMFYGNKTTSNGSTTSSLMGGGTSCERPDDKSAYWMPKFSRGGVQVTPGFSGFYFQTTKAGLNPDRTKPFPDGFRMIASDANGDVSWACTTNQNAGNVKPSLPSTCPRNSGLGLRFTFPECWDGKPAGADRQNSVVEAGRGGCPSHHPVQLPTLTMWPDFKGNYPSGSVRVSSGHHQFSGPSSMHADAFIAFRDDSMETLVRSCINGKDGRDPRPAKCDGNKFFD